ncbi:MAG: DUF3040 domain-containing protein [Acidimicrobiia bacterium]|nr:DUF3040 domain-containing protein [Acidimicrobiia bacterium]NNK92435.1 DUF3040 domain-containing protein [Acidimicrobiia bacterium]
MGLNEREQRILDEIERQFYEDDPHLAESVAKAALVRPRRHRNLAIAGIAVGLLVMLFFLTQKNPFAALGGFLLMVAGAAWLATSMRASSASGAASGLVERLQQRWSRES